MSRHFAFALLFASAALLPKAAHAAGDCPDGWFCEDGRPFAEGRPGPPPNPALTPGPAPQGPGAAPPAPGPEETPPFAPPSYPPPGEPDEPTIFVDCPENAPRPPVKRARRPFHEWGFNLHLEDAILGNRSSRAPNAGMGGVGFGFRYRPVPHLALEAGVDLLTGTDYQGYSRGEAALLLNTLVFFNPRDIVQIYALGGIGFSAADVTIAPSSGQASFPRHDEHYDYFGGQLGLGLEVRVSRSIALGGDIVGFIRGRTDSEARFSPEFEDPNTHRVTNTSGGGLLRVGATFYW